MAKKQFHRKLIEVALPLEKINEASVYEKFIRQGHPNNLHQWWSRKPLATARAVLFASLVDDPSEYLRDEASICIERERLFNLIEELVEWRNTYNNATLSKARLEIARSIARNIGVDEPIGNKETLEFLYEYGPKILDPFAGGGSIPLEAQRLGLKAYASDLNPISVLINKAMIEIPSYFESCPPIHTGRIRQQSFTKSIYRGADGLAEDIIYYGNWIREEAEKRIGNLYSKVRIPQYLGGGEAIVVAWIWARTVKCPNPACGAEMPLVSKWDLSKKKGRETWIQPIVDNKSKPAKIEYTIATGTGKRPERTVNRGRARCIACGFPVSLKYIQKEAQSDRMWNTLIAIAGKRNGKRIYLAPDKDQINLANSAFPSNGPEQRIGTGMVSNVGSYGFKCFADLFTRRQLVALITISDLIKKSHEKIISDARKAGYPDDDVGLEEGGLGARAYADAVVTYLTFALTKTLNRSCALIPWGVSVECPVNLFSRQIIPFIWDFAESNVISGPSGSFSNMFESTASALQKTAILDVRGGKAFQSDAVKAGRNVEFPVISTDPPYYDMIPYSDLSDFFYVWMRPILMDIFPDLFKTVLTPKAEELLADAHRYGSKDGAKEHFERGMLEIFSQFYQTASTDYPLTIYYAYRQREKKRDGKGIITAWETILTGIINAGFSITATWPMRTERAVKTASLNSNVLASSIVLVCRPRGEKAFFVTRNDFLAALREELPLALLDIQQANIAPVDFAQAAIGPGMSVFSRYSKVIEADGSSMSVRMSLTLINQVLDEFLAEQEGDIDADTRWAVAWFEQYGLKEGPFGDAETLSKAKNTSSDGLVRAGILEARGGKVRLLRRDELESDWDPSRDKRLTTWEVVQYLIRALEEGGEEEATILLRKLGGIGQEARDLAYRLYAICERKGWAQEALGYNMLAAAWPRLVEMAGRIGPSQDRLL
jgi:putative DNA methylase